MHVIDRTQAISNAVAEKFAIYAMLASNSYHKPDRPRFKVEWLGWIQVDLEGNPTHDPTEVHQFSGLAYDLFEKDETEEVVLAFRGTDDKKDYLWANLAIPPLNIQYHQARKAASAYIAKHPERKNNITVIGHSLGGGLALCVSVHYGLRAITFDPSPRVFDGVGDFHEPAERIIFFEAGEIVEVMRAVWTKDNEVVDHKYIYRCDYDFGPHVTRFERHRSDYLAFGMLGQGVGGDPHFQSVLDDAKAQALHGSPEGG